MVARRAHNPEVRGSSPLSATKKGQITWFVLFLLIHSPLQNTINIKEPIRGVDFKKYPDFNVAYQSRDNYSKISLLDTL